MNLVVQLPTNEGWKDIFSSSDRDEFDLWLLGLKIYRPDVFPHIAMCVEVEIIECRANFDGEARSCKAVEPGSSPGCGS
jgi:hypothetical protein